MTLTKALYNDLKFLYYYSRRFKAPLDIIIEGNQIRNDFDSIGTGVVPSGPSPYKIPADLKEVRRLRDEK